jgi:hypothetical protein
MLHGPGSQCAAADDVLGVVRAGGSTVVVVQGQPGISTTALPRYLGDKTRIFREVGCVGVEPEMEVACAGLHELGDSTDDPWSDGASSAGLPRRFTGEIRGG